MDVRAVGTLHNADQMLMKTPVSVLDQDRVLGICVALPIGWGGTYNLRRNGIFGKN